MKPCGNSAKRTAVPSPTTSAGYSGGIWRRGTIRRHDRASRPMGMLARGAPSKPSEAGLMGKGGARERSDACPTGRAEKSGLCDDARQRKEVLRLYPPGRRSIVDGTLPMGLIFLWVSKGDFFSGKETPFGRRGRGHTSPALSRARHPPRRGRGHTFPALRGARQSPPWPGPHLPRAQGSAAPPRRGRGHTFPALNGVRHPPPCPGPHAPAARGG